MHRLNSRRLYRPGLKPGAGAAINALGMAGRQRLEDTAPDSTNQPVMSTSPRVPARFAIAEHISGLLERELGQGVDARRMVNDALYARDILLVCEAQRGSELYALARQFRKAPAFRMRDPSPPSSGGMSSTGFDASRHGVQTDLSDLATGPTRSRPWYSPARWLRR